MEEVAESCGIYINVEKTNPCPSDEEVAAVEGV